MISYDIYKNRIRKIAAIKNFIVRFRVLFLALLALIIGLISAFLISKGMITGELVLPEEIVYGEKYEVEPGKALFSATRVEYAYLGRKEQGAQPLSASRTAKEAYSWSGELPKLAGEYLARTVTDKAFGKGYGKPVRFEIQTRPAEFVINSDSVVYGSDPGDYTFPLANGDRLQVEGLSFDFESFETDLTNVCANAQSFVILNAAGEDVTFCYEISTPEKEIALESKAVTLAPAVADFVYDGAPVSLQPLVDELTQTALGADRAQIVTVIKDGQGNALTEFPTAAGRYTLEIDQAHTAIFHGETDVTARYDLSYRSASFTIARRTAEIATASQKKEYDGIALSSAEVSVEGLAEGHRLVAVSALPELTNAGVLTNEYAFRIENGDGEDVTENYAPSFVYGTLEIIPRAAVLKSASAEQEYDGTLLMQTEGFSVLTESGEETGLPYGKPLVAGHAITVTGGTAIAYVSESGAANVLTFTVNDEFGNDVTANYAFEYVWGVLTVTKRAVTIRTATLTKEYDGKPLNGDDGAAEPNGLADGDYERADLKASVQNVTVKNGAPATVENNTTYRLYTTREGFEREVTDNYEIAYEYGTLKITPRPIAIYTPSESWVYDGRDHISADGCEIRYAKDETGFGFVAENHVPVITKIASVRNVGTALNEWEILVGERVDDPDGKYDFQDNNFNRYLDVTRNYEFAKWDCGTLEVTKRPITIFTPTASKPFDGAPFEDTENYNVEGYGLSDGHAIRVKAGTEIPSVTYVTEGEVRNELAYAVFDGAGNDLTENYEIGYEYGKIWRTKRPITIVTGTMHTEYDGLPLQNPSAAPYHGTDSGLVGEHMIVLDESQTIPSVTFVTEGEVENALIYLIYDGDTDRTGNYEIMYDYGVLYRTKRAITVTTSSFEKTYDGLPLWGNAHPESGVDEAFADRLAQGEDFRDEIRAISDKIAYALDAVWNPTEWKDDVVWNDDFIWTDFYVLGYVTNRTEYAVYGSDGSDRSGNYEITYEYGALTITPKTIRVQTPDDTKPYDGIPLSNTDVSYDPLVEGETLLVSAFSSILDLGRIENRVVLMAQRPSSDPIFGDYLTEDTTRNYTFEYTYGTLEITKHDLKVHTATLSKIYDGAGLRSDAEPDGETIFGTAAWFEGLVSGDSCESDKEHIFSIVRAESAPNTTKYRVYADRNGEKTDITENYKITYEEGALTVSRRPIRILTETATKEYDGERFTATEGWKIVSELGLVGGHTLAVKEGTVPASVTNVKGNGLAEEGEKNIVEYEVTEQGTIVSENYEITYEYGYINRTPRGILILTNSATWVYDGEAHEDGGWQLIQHAWELPDGGSAVGGNALVLDHELKLLAPMKIVDVGTVENKCTYEVVDGNGDSVTYNYKFSYQYGTLEVTPRPLKITTESHDTVYDGLPMEHRVAAAEEFDKAAQRGIVAGHEIVLNTEAKIASVTYVAEGNVENELHYFVKNGETDLSGNYEIEYEYGEIRRTKRAVTVTTATLEKEFDGEYLYGTDGETDYGDLANGDYAESDFVASMREVSIGNGAPVAIGNNTTYKFFTERGGEKREVTDNYEITYRNGTLKITPRKIEVESPDGEWVYDGKDHTTDHYLVRHVTESGKDNDDFSTYGHEELTVKNTVIRDAGTKKNEFEIQIVEVVSEGDGNAYRDVTYNYEIVNEIYGTLKVTKRPITLAVQNQVKIYDGLPLPENPKAILWGPVGDPDAGFAEGQEIDQDTIVCEGSQTEAGESDIILTACKIGVYEGFTKIEDTTENYEITFVAGKLTVNKRPITVTARDQSKVYDATPLPVDPEYQITTSVSDGSLLGKAGQTAAGVSFAGSQTNAGNSPLVVSDLKIVINGESGETDVTKNYEITYVAGTLTVTPRPLLITTASNDTVYDGSPMEHRVASAEPFHESAHRGIVAGHRIVLDESKTIASVTYVTEGSVRNELHYLVKDGETDLSGNYEISYDYGEIRRTLRPLSYTTESETKEYDGAPLAKAGIACSENGLASSDRAVGITAPEITDAGTRTNDIAIRIERTENGSDVTANYEITHTFGTLAVTPRVIEITTASKEFEYDGTTHYDTSASNVYHVASGGEEKGLVLKHALKATEWTEITDAGEEENVCVYIVIDPDAPEKDVNRNYTVKVVGHGALKVTPRKIVAVTGSTQFVYDGDPHSYTESVSAVKAEGAGSGLVLDHKLVADPNNPIFSATDVRDTKAENNKFTCLVQDGAGNDVGKNYEIVRYEYGTIEILPRPIVIHSPKDEKEYDGAPLKNDAYTADNLVTKLGHEPIAQNDPVEIVNVGERENGNEFKILAGEADVTENYEITYDFGMLKITPRKLTLSPKALGNLTYGDSFGGYERGKNNFAYGEGSKRAVDGEELEITVYYTTDAAGNNRATVKDADVYYVWIELNGYTVSKNGAQVAEKNYALEQAETVSFEILKKQLRIRLHDAEGKVYDGEVYTFPADGFDFTEGTNTAYNETLTLGILYFNEKLDKYTQALNAGVYTITIDPSACRIDGSVPATRNYSILSSTVKYEITKRQFTVALQNEEHRVYNAQPFDYSREGHIFECEGVLAGDRFEGVTFCLDENGAEVSAVFAGAYTVRLRETGWEIYGATGKVTENYTLSDATDGALQILPRKITVSVRFDGRDSYETEYTGLPVSVPQGSFESRSEDGGAGFVNGDELSVTQTYTYRQNGAETEPIEPGRYAVSLSLTGSELVAKNYEITYEDGVLEIVKRHVVVQPKIEGALEYNGEPLDRGLLDFIHWHKDFPDEEGFVDGDEQYYEPAYRITDLATGEDYAWDQPLQAGDYLLYVTLSIRDGFQGGYSIEYGTAYFYVAQRAIGVRIDDYEKEYDKKPVGTDLFSFADYYAPNDGETGFVKDDAQIATPVYEFEKEGDLFESAVNAGGYVIRISRFTDEDGWITRNYDLTDQGAGALTISPRKIVIVPTRYSDLFTSMSQVVSLPRDHFELLSGSLAEGDKLEVYGDNALRATEDFIAWVGIASVSITDRKTGENTAGNYTALYEYDETNPDLAGYNEMKFTATLTFGKRKTEIRQNVPPAGYSVVQYEGERVTIPFRGEGSELFTNVSFNDRSDKTVTQAEYGLLSGHRIVITDAYTDDRPGVTQKWLRGWEIVDADGYDVTYFYTVTVNASDPATHITVRARELKVTAAGIPSDYSEGDIVGILALEGELFEEQKIEIKVVGGKFVATVFEEFELGPDDVRRIDRTKYYSIEIVSQA